MAGAYIHIPFCSHICYYCDFNKVFIEGQPVDDYVDMLIREMNLVMASHPDERIETVYVGGGTPTTLTPAQLERLITGIRAALHFDAGEFTFEANPNDLLTTDKLQVLHDNGVNRLSIGVQSFNDDILKRIGRTHRAADVYQAIANARKVGFENLSIDLIFRLPQQTREDFLASLHQALDLDLPHYSTYSLILERKTIFYNLMRKGRLQLPNQDTEADMYQDAIDLMVTHGLAQYEISNFAKPGYQCQHNLLYWRNDHYFGFGAGAFGYVGRDRYHNFGPIQQYLAPLHDHKVPVIEHHLVPLEEQVEEEMFLGLRTREGVSRQRFADRYHMSVEAVYGELLDQLVDQQLLEVDDQRIRLTNKGQFLGNEVFQQFLLDDQLV
ncbi:MAG: radical SAM family heme chaperone HemW [Lactobacillus sp.]|jgi:oxygen-independent coproporphyrinogen-3 oxidase|uniref:Heme chaperone HemW n=1 Tax=Lacticaseibacillus suilingensis TaxID=2799577 RepID=A0ABW4BGW9_9LACO|nr:radical SAM family heme chaperone HemW [Lacticaseibacillus suilingensis]MCI1894978.1 radical SAM family heme chaperone HemW [Lactobacillus sp.]MCI1917756.1 radical SAM family heme chaperone HemW [Lactobacillus sp.]MCI1940761.1 radical SAM family heme chaperone HemW [Lactobacillus sp.]MCI1971447.1 radical SAM family heme chaperone HemW [Lactobacillus sp.]MCI2017577.1 radical SAM family heme chaperone HemW [Lactobacillus sp.]